LSHQHDSYPVNSSRFGLSVALTTAFDENNKIDIARTLDHAKNCLEAGCNSVTLFGTTGEGASIAVCERGVVLDSFIAGGIPTSQIIIGVMESAATAAAWQITGALRRGCKAVMLAPPFYYKNLSEDGLFAWFKSVFEQVGDDLRDIILYNIPAVTAVELSLSLIDRLRTTFGVAILGVKDSSGNWDYTQQLLAAHKDCAILIGDEHHLAHGVRLGGQGAISGMANLCAARLLPLVEQGRDDAGLNEAIDQMSAHSITPAIKTVLAHIRRDKIWMRMRPPLDTLEPDQFTALAQIYDQMLSPQVERG